MSKFYQYVWVPLVQPKIVLDREAFLKMYDNNAQRIDEDFSRKIDNPWTILRLRSEFREPSPGEKAGSGWHPYIKQTFPQLVECVENLPMISIKSVFVFEQISDVKPHIDFTRELDVEIEPATYRYELFNDCPGESLYFLGKDDKKFFIKLPENTNLWCHSNIHGHHGAIKVPSPKRKLLMGVWGTLDKERHLDLVQRSIDQYQDQCIKITDLQ